MSVRNRLAVLQIGLLLAVCLFLFFFGLGAFGLVGADEPRYAQIAREMLARRDWVLPTLNGSPWLEKPALLYWKMMSAYTFLGVYDWVARVPAAAHATTLALAVFFFMRRFRPGSELDAALMTASCAGVIGFARGASTDMPLTACFAMALLAWWAWHATGRKLWLAAFYLLLGFGALAKGPIAPALAVLIVGSYAVARRDGRVFLRSLWWPGFALFFATVLPWYVAVQLRDQQFFHVFFLENNLARFGTNLYRHAQPFWYYIPVFLLFTLPWTVFTLPALVDACRSAWKKLRHNDEALTVPAAAESAASPADSANADELPVFLLLWIAIPIAFFSISQSKLPGYILPAIPPAALLTAAYLHRGKAIPRLSLMLHSLLCGVILGAAFLFPWSLFLKRQPHCGFWCELRMLSQLLPDGAKFWIVLIAGVVAVLVLVVVRRGGLPTLHFATLVPLVLALVFLLRFAVIDQNNPYPTKGLVLDITRSARPVNLELGHLGVKEETPVAVFDLPRDIAYGLNFYRNQPISYYESERPRDLPSGIPAGEHVVIARQGSQGAIEALVAPRSIRRLGDFPPQHLEFFLVSNLK